MLAYNCDRCELISLENFWRERANVSQYVTAYLALANTVPSELIAEIVRQNARPLVREVKQVDTHLFAVVAVAP